MTDPSKKNWVRKLEAVVQPWVLVLLFLVAVVFGFAREARADEVTVEIGPTFLSGEFSEGVGTAMYQTWDDRWRFGMGYISQQYVEPRREPRTYVRPNLYLQGQRLVPVSERFKLGIGVAYMNAETRWNGSKFVASLSIEFDINERWDVKFRHWSNAGSASPNMGQDMLVVGYSFGPLF